MPTVSAHFRSLYSSFRGMAHSTRVVRVLPRFYSSNRRRWLRLLPAAVLGRSRAPLGAAVDAGTQFHAVRPASRRVRRLNFTANCARRSRRISTDPHGVITGSGRDRPTDERTDGLTGTERARTSPARVRSVPNFDHK